MSYQPPQYDQRLHQQRIGAQPRHAPRQPQSSRPPRRKIRKGRLVLSAIIAVALIVAVSAALSGGGGASASWKARVTNYVVINPADLAVTVQVTDTGKAAGTPTCTVQASDAAYAYTGFDEGTLDRPVQPGATTTYVDNVTITHQGAQYVTQVTVSC